MTYRIKKIDDLNTNIAITEFSDIFRKLRFTVLRTEDVALATITNGLGFGPDTFGDEVGKNLAIRFEIESDDGDIHTYKVAPTPVFFSDNHTTSFSFDMSAGD